MFYVIPSWYGDHAKNPFDDAVQHVKLFQTAGEETQLVILSYMPQLRYFLHQKELFERSYWSLFDALQGISDVPARLYHFKDLSWPEGTAFTFTPFLIIAYAQGQLLAHIHLGEDGQLQTIHYFKEQQLWQTLMMDDRGFISTVCYYQQGKASHKDYLNRYGFWQFREYLLDDNHRVVVNPEAHYPFQQDSYDSLEQLQQEAIQTYVKQHITDTDTVWIAADRRHNAAIFSSLSRAKVILSFFEGREQASQSIDAEMVSQMARADVIVTDRRSWLPDLQAATRQPVIQVSPFDTRLRLGHSQQMKEQYLYVVLDTLQVREQSQLLTVLFELMAKDDSLRLCLVSYETDPAAKANCRHHVLEQLAAADCPYLFLEDDETPSYEDNEEGQKSRVSLYQTRNEQEIIQLLDQTRLVIDLGPEPDLYTQIAAISAGIPQVNSCPSEFVSHLKNGYIIESIAQLEEVHAYYLIGLRNWNEALVYATQKLAAYTSGNIVRYVKEQMGWKADES